MTDQPADLLAAAATVLREAANAAIHDGRTTWQIGSTCGSKSPVVVDNPGVPTVLIETWAPRLEAVNAYLALVGPATGLAIAAWLEDEAGFQRHAAAGPEDSEHALAVARAVLGQDGDQK
ncbi:hypothetical protein ACGF0D_10575 [Kitasatospora sp. NPDC048298]|uniref:hypothetical protein n=1 Tax=Kitasatospora sp. NPDC048298 TaxID=3364049 RepID=UPI00370F9C2A